MRVVAVGAGHALAVHLAAQERAQVEHLVAHLAIVAVQPRLDQRGAKAVGQPVAGLPLVAELAAPCMAAGAGVDLARAVARRRARGVAGDRGYRPQHAAALIQQVAQAFGGIGRAGRGVFAAGLALGPGQVPGARAVAGLAADVDVGSGGVVVLGLLVVLLAQVGGMAIGALVVPDLVDAGPVQRLAGFQLAVGVEGEPALAALRGGPAVPGDAQGLQAAAGKADQVLCCKGAWPKV